MPLTPISKDYIHDSCGISVEGNSDRDSLAGLRAPLTCTIKLGTGDRSKSFTGGGELLQDMVTTLDRYLAALLRGEPQGAFSGAVAIRPLNAVKHRITVRQGNGIGQADLGMGELYDLAESLEDVRQTIPHLETLKSPVVSMAWYRRPAVSMAAVALVAVGVTIGSVVLLGGDRTQQTATREAEERIEAVQQEVPVAPPAPAAVPPPPSVEVAEQELADDLAGSAEPLASNALTGSAGEIAGLDPSDSTAARSFTQSVPLPSEANAADPDTTPSVAILPEESRQRLGRQDLAVLATQFETQLGNTWAVPEDLTEDLTYTVQLSTTGTVVSVEPLSEVAATFQSQTPLATNFDLALDAAGEDAEDALPPLEVTFAQDGAVSVTVAEEAE